MTEGTGMWPNKRLQEFSDACDDARIRVARAMTDPKDTIELNEARAELTRLEQIVGAYTSPGGPRVYGSGCSTNATGYRDLHGFGETGANDVVYSGAQRYFNQQTETDYDEAKVTGQRAKVDWADDQLPRKL
jgi:hypothetical protein